MPYDDIDGRWDRLNVNDPAVTAQVEQLRSEALTLVRESRTFAVLSIAPNTNAVRTCSIIAADVESDEHEAPDVSRLEHALCETLVRSWFEDYPDYDDASVLDMLVLASSHRQLLDNVHTMSLKILAEKGYDITRWDD